MRPARFKYTRAESLPAALEALADGGIALAGGQALLPLLKLRQAAPPSLVDINRLTELSQIAVDRDALVIGALARVADLATSADAQAAAPWLVQAASLLGDPQTRNRATVAGNACFADPRANLLPGLIALDAEATVRSGGETRTLPVERLATGFRANALAPNELVTELRLSLPSADTRGSYSEVARQPSGLPMVNVSVQVTGSPVTRAGIVAGGLGSTPVRLAVLEQALIGQVLDGEHIAAAVGRLDELELEPIDDMHAPPSYRRAVAKVLVRRALETIAEETR
jgi:carbon-monoxide dehydrogenase medium subunit